MNRRASSISIHHSSICVDSGSVTENSTGGGLLATLNIPFVAVRTPSDESNRSSSHNSSPSRHLSSSSHDRQQRSLSNTRMSVRETVKSLFRSSKTVDNMSSTSNGVTSLINPTQSNRNLSKSKFASPLINNQLSHSQPIVTESMMNDNLYFESPLVGHSEQTPLIDRRKDSKQADPLKTAAGDPQENLAKETRLNRRGLHLPLDIEGLHRSRSCTDDIVMPSNQQETDLANGTNAVPTITASLQLNHSEVVSLRSSDSTASSLSAYLTSQPSFPGQLSAPSQTNSNGKNEMTKSQESLFSFSSPVQKQRSFKSLMMAAATKDPATKQGNEVLFLIANWVLRSPEDFQGKRRAPHSPVGLPLFYMCLFSIDYLVQKELRSFFALLESLRSSFRSWTSQIKEILALQVICGIMFRRDILIEHHDFFLAGHWVTVRCRNGRCHQWRHLPRICQDATRHHFRTLSLLEGRSCDSSSCPTTSGSLARRKSWPCRR